MAEWIQEGKGKTKLKQDSKKLTTKGNKMYMKD